MPRLAVDNSLVVVVLAGAPRVQAVGGGASALSPARDASTQLRKSPIPDESEHKLDTLLLRGAEVEALAKLLNDFGAATEARDVPALRNSA